MHNEADNISVIATSPVLRRLGRRLRELLRNELLVQHRVIAVAARTREAIIGREVSTLAGLQVQQAELLAEAERLAGERMEVSESIAGAEHFPAQGLTLSAVMDCLPGDIAVEISVLRELLITAAQKVRDSGEINRGLLQNELEYVGASLEVLARAAAPRRGYHAPLRSVDAASIMLDRAA